MILLSKQRMYKKKEVFRSSPRTALRCKHILFLIVIGVTFYMLFMVIAIFFISFSISAIDLCEMCMFVYEIKQQLIYK